MGERASLSVAHLVLLEDAPEPDYPQGELDAETWNIIRGSARDGFSRGILEEPQTLHRNSPRRTSCLSKCL